MTVEHRGARISCSWAASRRPECLRVSAGLGVGRPETEV